MNILRWPFAVLFALINVVAGYTKRDAADTTVGFWNRFRREFKAVKGTP
jgi:hypothetical protein